MFVSRWKRTQWQNVCIEVYTKVTLINMLIPYAQSSLPHLPEILNQHNSFQAKQWIRLTQIFASYFRTHLRRRVKGADCKPCISESFNLIAFLINAIFNADLLAPNSFPDYLSKQVFLYTWDWRKIGVRHECFLPKVIWKEIQFRFWGLWK